MISTLNQEIVIDLKNFDKDFLFLNKSIKSLRKKYPNKFVVIKDRKVMSSGDNLKEAMEIAKKRGVAVEKAIIEFIPKKDEVFIL